MGVRTVAVLLAGVGSTAAAVASVALVVHTALGVWAEPPWPDIVAWVVGHTPVAAVDSGRVAGRGLLVAPAQLY